jgi:hypothetical protein
LHRIVGIVGRNLPILGLDAGEQLDEECMLTELVTQQRGPVARLASKVVARSAPLPNKVP